MSWVYDKIFAYPTLAAVDQFIFVNTQDINSYPKISRYGFSAVGFPIKTWKGDSNISYPIVVDDFTTTSYPFTIFESMEEITLKDVPAKIKTRFTKWEKHQ